MPSSNQFLQLFLPSVLIATMAAGCDNNLAGPGDPPGPGGPGGLGGPGGPGGPGAGNPGGFAPVAEAPPVSDELYTLGQALFFDKILSGNRDVSCASCHHPDVGTDDDLALPLGVGASGIGSERSGGTRIGRNAPALFNLHLYPALFWDSRVSLNQDGEIQTPAGAQLTAGMRQTLALGGLVGAQAMFPVTSSAEMRGAPGSNELADLEADDFTGIWAGLMTRLGQVDGYVDLFESAYPGTPYEDMTFAHAGNAIAAFEFRAFSRTDSPFQQFLRGDPDALSQEERDGMNDFVRAGCTDCHRGPLLSDFDHHNTALAQLGPGAGHGAEARDDFGRAGQTGRAEDRYAFRTPPLINVELSAPYGHAGQFADLSEFIRHYRNPEDQLEGYDAHEHVEDVDLARSVLDNIDAILATLDRHTNARPFNNNAVVAFLEALTADDAADLSDTVPASVPSGIPTH